MIPYTVRMTRDAIGDFGGLRAFDRSRIREAIATQLLHEPTKMTHHCKPLNVNPFASWELRVGDWRVLYDVDEEMHEVENVALGRKIHDKLVVRGKEWDL